MTAAPRETMGGWTLIEAAAVLVIVAVLAAVAAPRLTGPLGGVPAEAAVNQLIMDLQYARTRAMNRSEPLQLTVDTDGYRLLTNEGTALPFADQQGSDNGDLHRSFDGITFNADDDNTVTFEPATGDVLAARTITINKRNQSRTLTIQAPTGLAEEAP